MQDFVIDNLTLLILLIVGISLLLFLIKMAKNFTSREADYSAWYNELVERADLAEHSAVRGCMVIKPYGYAIWEKMQAELDRMFKETGHENAYFPLFVPKSLFEAEEKNAEGFAKECAVVTHYRLQNDPGAPVTVDCSMLHKTFVLITLSGITTTAEATKRISATNRGNPDQPPPPVPVSSLQNMTCS
mgnify:CR=1 FL=1